MKRLGFGFVLLMAIAFFVVVGWNTLQQQLQPSTSIRFVTTSAPLDVEIPTVDDDRLLDHLKVLAFPRYEESDRQEAAEYIQAALEDAGWTMATQAFTSDGKSGTNLYAVRPGTDDAAGTILVGAHYDTVERSPGVDDNATGVATVLEVARLFGDRPTPHSLEIVFFDQEEAGLLGSQAFVSAAENRDDLEAAVILDMVGYACHTEGCQRYPTLLPITPPTNIGDFVTVVGNQAHASLLPSFQIITDEALPPLYTLAIPSIAGVTPDIMRSDHAPFWEKGIGAVMVTDTANFRNPYYHTDADILENIDQDFFVGAAQHVVNAVAILLHQNPLSSDHQQALIAPQLSSAVAERSKVAGSLGSSS
jgi:hypothetical protein